MVQALFQGVLPIFAIAAIGYFMGKRGIFDPAEAGIINKVVFLIAIPALIFRLIINAPFAEFDWMLLVGFFLSEMVIYLLGFLLAWKLFRCEANEAVLLGLAASYANHVLFVLPIAATLFGEAATLPIVAIIALDSVAIFGGSIVIMEAMDGAEFSFLAIFKKIFQNPALLAMLAGILFAFTKIEPPYGVHIFLTFVGNAAAPCALFSLGIVLSQTRTWDRIAPTVSVSALKLVAHPVVAWLILSGIFGFDLAAAKTSMMVAAAPSGAMAFVLAVNYQVRTDAIAPTILITTIGSLATVSVVASF